jgi:hypothetical protein
MDQTDNGYSSDAWLSARLGNAIDVIVDRTLSRPQLGSDPSQAYGIDANGNVYQLGQMNGQVRATVTPTNGGGLTISPTLILIGIAAFMLLGSK